MKSTGMKVEGRRTAFVRFVASVSLGLLASTFLPADNTPTPTPAPPPAPVPATDDATAAHQGYPPDRYQELWTHSPFSVATPDQTVTDSAEYSFVGYAQAQSASGTTISYVSLVEKQNQNHILISSDKPLDGLVLNSVDKRSDGVYANLTRQGTPLTLKLEAPVLGVAASPSMPSPNGFGGPQNTVPGLVNPGFVNPATGRPFIRIRRPVIHVPPRINNGAPGQPPPPPTPNQ